MRKNGRTAAGSQRWKCGACAVTYTFVRKDLREQATFAAFIDYLLGKNTQHELDGTITGRSTRHRFLWCWDVPTPPLAVTGEIHDQVFIDGIYLAYNWVLLTAVNERSEVIATQWATSENAAAGKALQALSKRLLKIRDTEEATAWSVLLAQFHSQYKDWLNERTYARDDPDEARRRGKQKPTQWWYTHDRDRRVYYRLERLSKDGTLFNFLTANPDQVLHSTTNIAESLNARINAVCYHHRGLSQSHMLTAIDWALYYRSIAPKNPRQIYTQWDHTGRPRRAIIPKKTKKPTERIGPAHYDTGLTAEEGLWTRKGWAGRPNQPTTRRQ